MRTPYKHIAGLSEQERVDNLLKQVDRTRALQDIQWEAYWLHSPVRSGSDPWFVRTPNSREVNGVWQGLARIDWDYPLPDGTNISAPENADLLGFVQDLSFLVREHTQSRFESGLSYLNEVSFIRKIVRWSSLHPRLLNVRENAFSRFTSKNIGQFLSEYSAGGTFLTLKIADRFLELTTSSANPKIRDSAREISAPFKLSKGIRDAVIEWLDAHNFYKKSKKSSSVKGGRYVNRTLIADKLGVDTQTLNTPNCIAFFRQFEPEIESLFPNLCVTSVSFSTEHPSQRTLTLEAASKVRTSSSAMQEAIRCFDRILSLHDLLPSQIPVHKHPPSENFSRLLRNAPIEGHTPWMPFETSLAYLNESLRWVQVYGETLVTFYLESWNHFKLKGWIGSDDATTQNSHRTSRETWFLRNIPTELRIFNLSGWGPAMDENPHTSRREAPSMSEVMSVFVGACLHLISGLILSRVSEITTLRKDCFSTDGAGFFISKLRKKAINQDKNLSTTVPTPSILVKAAALIARLSSEMCKITNDVIPDDREFLFFLPEFRCVNEPYMCRLTKKSASTFFDRFCDYVNLPTDELGRQWYVRVHENRKSFILTFVWLYKFAALDSLRALAGHTDINQILAYLKAEFPGIEIPELEADYLAYAMWNFESSGKKRSPVVDLDKLYKQVCRHFSVREISEVSEDELHQWLSYCLEDNKYQLTAIRITDGNQHTRIAVKVVLR